MLTKIRKMFLSGAIMATPFTAANAFVVESFRIDDGIESPQCRIGGDCTYKYERHSGISSRVKVRVVANSHSVKVDDDLKIKCTDGTSVNYEMRDDRFIVREGRSWESQWYSCPSGALIRKVRVKAGTVELIPDDSTSYLELIVP